MARERLPPVRLGPATLCGLLRMRQPVEKVGAEPKVTTNRAPEAPKSPKFGVFGARSGVGVGIEGVFQQAGVFSEVRTRLKALASWRRDKG